MIGRATRRRGKRYQRLTTIQQMDPETDYHEIWWLDLVYEFPWDLDIGSWLAFYNTITPPDDARMLARTGEMITRTHERLDHMASLMWEMNYNGFGDPRGKAAVRQMNRIHRNSVKHVNAAGEQWDITNEQYLYVLATTMLTPQRWLDNYGWRPVSPHERRAAVRFIRDFGRHMGLKDIPETYEEFERFHDEYEAKHVIYTPEAAELWQATRYRLVDKLTLWLPPWLRRRSEPLALKVLPVLLSDAQRRAFGLPEPSAWWRAVVRAGLKARAIYVRWSGPRVTPATPARLPTRTYPSGEYEITEIGPTHTVGAAQPKQDTGLANHIAGLSATERQHRLVEVVRAEAASVLEHAGLEHSAPVRRDQAFSELGFTSLAAVELRNRLNEVTGLTLSATVVFDHPTSEALARHIGERLASSDGEEIRVRATLATIPLARLRAAGLLDPLLELAEAPVEPVEREQPGQAPATQAPDVEIDDLDAADLIRMAFDGSES